MGLRSLACALGVLSTACTAAPPDVPPAPDGSVANVSTFVDVVLAIADGSNAQDITACFMGLPNCGSVPSPPPGPCSNNAALGKNDGKVFEIAPFGHIDLGFTCSFIRETGGTAASPDFKIWGQATAAAMPVVEVSQDASTYTAVNLWPKAANGYAPDPSFNLEVPMLAQARYVRISEVGGLGSIFIDAVEALPIVVGP